MDTHAEGAFVLVTVDESGSRVESRADSYDDALRILRLNFAQGDDVSDDDLENFVRSQGVAVEISDSWEHLHTPPHRRRAAVARPVIWQSNGDPTRYGRVDFDTDSGETVATVRVVRNADGTHTVHVDTHGFDDVSVRFSED